MAGHVLENKSESSLLDIPYVGPYRPSWIDRLTAAVERLPVPYWLVYLVLFVAEVGIFHAIGWADGWVPRFRFEPLLLLFPIWLCGPLAIMTYLDGVALESLRAFRPLLEVDDEALKHLEYKFTTMPFRPVIMSGLFWSATYVIFYYVAFPIWKQLYSVGPLATKWGIVTGLFTYFAGATIYYHTIRQLRLVSQTVATVRRFNLFRLDPVYAFSRLTARTGVAWVFLVSVTLLIFPLSLSPVPLIILSTIQITLALAAFVLPLWSVHQRLVSEKRSLIADLNLQVEAAIRRLHRHLDEDDPSTITGAKDAFAGLAAERDVLAKIPTWPWRAGTLTGILSALALPIVLFLIQVALERWLGP